MIHTFSQMFHGVVNQNHAVAVAVAVEVAAEVTAALAVAFNL